MTSLEFHSNKGEKWSRMHRWDGTHTFFSYWYVGSSDATVRRVLLLLLFFCFVLFFTSKSMQIESSLSALEFQLHICDSSSDPYNWEVWNGTDSNGMSHERIQERGIPLCPPCSLFRRHFYWVEITKAVVCGKIQTLSSASLCIGKKRGEKINDIIPLHTSERTWVH